MKDKEQVGVTQFEQTSSISITHRKIDRRILFCSKMLHEILLTFSVSSVVKFPSDRRNMNFLCIYLPVDLKPRRSSGTSCQFSLLKTVTTFQQVSLTVVS